MREYTPAQVCEYLGITPSQLTQLLDLSAIDIAGTRDALSVAEVKEIRAYLPVPECWIMDEMLKELHALRVALSRRFP